VLPAPVAQVEPEEIREAVEVKMVKGEREVLELQRAQSLSVAR
jgi:hypothetical protein